MTNDCNRLDLELFFAGELSGDRKATVEQHIKTCESCSGVYNELEASKKGFLSQHPFSTFSRAHAPLKTIPWYQTILRFPGKTTLLPGLSAIIVLIVLLPYLQKTFLSNMTYTRFKGKSSIGYIYERNNKIYQQTSNDHFRAGDKIQILYTSPVRKFISLISVDIQGTLSFYKSNDSISIPVTHGTNVSYPLSIELDNTPGQELLIACFSDRPLSFTQINEYVLMFRSKYNNLTALKNSLDHNQKGLPADVVTLLLNKE